MGAPLLLLWLTASCFAVTPELRFVPTKYHPYIQSSVRRVFLSPSATVQDLQTRIEELEHHVERLQSKNSSLKLQCANSKKDADRLMDRYEAHIKAITNYQENERKLREETENLCNDVHELQQEADTYKTKYHQMKEKYKQLRNSVAPYVCCHPFITLRLTFVAHTVHPILLRIQQPNAVAHKLLLTSPMAGPPTEANPPAASSPPSPSVHG